MDAPPSIPHILRLPNELLHIIASNVEDNDLCQLAFVNRELRHVAQDALLKEVWLPLNADHHPAIPKFLRMCINHPDLISRIHNVNLSDYKKYGSDSSFGHRREPIDINVYRSLEKFMYGTGTFNAIVRSAMSQKRSLWTLMGRFNLNALIVLIPGLKHLSLQLPDLRENRDLFGNLRLVDWSRVSEPISLFEDPGLRILETKLRFLTINPAASSRFDNTSNITVHSLSSLVRLTIPLASFLRGGLDCTNISEVLPPSLEYLSLGQCDIHISCWLSELVRSHESALPHLCQVVLCFPSCLRSILLLIGQKHGGEFFRDHISSLARKGLNVVTYNSLNDTYGNILEESDALSYLPDFEIWLTSSKGEQFSSTVARTESGRPRRRTKEETRRFLQSHQALDTIRSTREFEPELSLNGLPVIYFEECEWCTPSVLRYTPDVGVWAEIRSSFAPMTMMAPSTRDLSLIKFWSPQSAPRTEAEALSTFECPFRLPETPTLVEKFNASHWLGLNFFSKPQTMD